jgi:S-adenosylmethionine:tRNA-ribosyltransferase-isomerase (queuine synthetase)
MLPSYIKKEIRHDFITAIAETQHIDFKIAEEIYESENGSVQLPTVERRFENEFIRPNRKL